MNLYITKYESHSQKVLIDEGKISLYGLEYDIDELMADVEKRAELEQYGVELSVLEIADTLINGKIDEKEFEQLPPHDRNVALIDAIDAELKKTDLSMEEIDNLLDKRKSIQDSISKQLNS